MIQKYKDFTQLVERADIQSIESPFYIFGSENSQDYDVLVSVDNIPKNIDDAHNICKYFNDKLSKILSDKPLNFNSDLTSKNSIITLLISN